MDEHSPVRLVVGPNSVGKTGFVVAKYQVLPVSATRLLRGKGFDPQMIIHAALRSFPVSRTGSRASPLFDTLAQAYGQNVAVDFLFCGKAELKRRRAGRTHSEYATMKRADIQPSEEDYTDGYSDYVQRCFQCLEARNWPVTFYHSWNLRYYKVDAATFHRITTHGEQGRDKMLYKLGWIRPSVVRGHVVE